VSELDSTRVGIVTGPRVPELSGGGRQLVAELEAQGANAQPVVWTAGEDPSDFDVLVFRSCWDYHERIGEFRAWLDELADAAVTVLNPLAAVRWNVHKFYLRDLAAAGVPILDTAFVGAGEATRLSDVLEQRGWREAVVKPAVGTSSTDTWRTNRAGGDDHQERFASMVGDGDVLIQRFAPEIRDGERSLVFFGGAFSHAFRRDPATGDFRAHPAFDATIRQYEPAASTIEDASAALAAVGDAVGVPPSALPYARVDGVLRDAEFVLMELELVEPWLGLDRVDGAAERFADAIGDALGA
jgi:glutathione synthase/RimK-type ligase-like ATP-grasp enzyme